MDNLKQELFNRGANLVGFAVVEGLYHKCDLIEESTVDSEVEEFSLPEYPRAISIAVAIPKDVIKGISLRPTIEYYDMYNSLNHQLRILGEFCEEYIQNEGYNAYALTPDRVKEYGVFKTLMPHKTVAINSGIGWIGKSALLVTPEYGSAIRLISVLTDAPIVADEKIEATKCNNCNICTNACPGGAITGNLWDHNKSRDWIFNAMACRKKAREIAAHAINKEITLCGKCIEVCPYTQKYINS